MPPDIDTAESKRKLYVGITRAKSLLHMHYTGDVFDKFTDAASTDEIDLHSYSKPTELIMQLSHRDVYLDFFKDKKLLISSVLISCGFLNGLTLILGFATAESLISRFSGA